MPRITRIQEERMTLDEFHAAADAAGVLVEASPIGADMTGKLASYKLTIVGEGGHTELSVSGRHGKPFIPRDLAMRAFAAAASSVGGETRVAIRTDATNAAVIAAASPSDEPSPVVSA